MAVRMTSADVVAINSSEEAVGMIVEVGKRFPEIRVFPAGAVNETAYSTIVRTDDPTAGFRPINTGRSRNVGTIVRRTVQCYYLDGSFDIDDAAVEGVDWGDPIAEQRDAHFRAAMRALCSQIYYGVSANASGFAGLASILDNSDDDMVVDAGGTTESTATSVWALRLGIQAVSFAWGNGGKIGIGDITSQQLYDDDGKPYTGKFQKVAGYTGLQLTNLQSMARIANITEDSGKGLTDSLLSQLMAKFRVGEEPDVILMSRRSARQLRDSRTATNETGKEAPIPKDFDGVPIERTDSIVDTETLLTAAGT